MQTTRIPKLTPIIHPWISDVTRDYENLNGWISKWGSPINLLNLISFGQNFLKFDRMFGRYGIRGRVFFARKANKCKCFVWAAKEYGFGVDTASLNEMKDCVQAGIQPERITITAAVKNRELLSFAVQHQIPVILDNLDECELLHEILEDQGMQLHVGFRIGGFEFEGKKLYTRFGFDVDETVPFLAENLTDTGKFRRFIYKGLHFHLNGYSTAERAAALSQTIGIADALDAMGMKTKFIDIGGGILMNYLKSKREWDEFHEVLRESLLDDRDEITFQKDTLGMVKVENKLIGNPKVYPYYNELNQEHFVEKILSVPYLGKPIYLHLRERHIELRLEPGRSLLDQAGITVAKVAFRKQDNSGRQLIGLEMNRTQLFSSSADFLLDPIFIPRERKQFETPCEVYFVGAYCLEQELILKRKIQIAQYPEIGDLVCFVNTAGYMMHFYESEAHRFDLAKNLVLEKDSKWEAYPDEDYIGEEILGT